MSRIVLVAQPFLRLLNRGDREIPMALCGLAGFLEQGGHEVVVYNADLANEESRSDEEISHQALFDASADYKRRLADRDDPIWQEVVERIVALRPDVLGFKLLAGTYQSARVIAELVKQRLPDLPIVVGGSMASIAPKTVLLVDSFDYCIQAEGEEALLELVDTLSAGGDVSGIANLGFRREGKAVVNCCRPYIEDLDTLPYPAWNTLLDLERYPPTGIGLLFTSRGCPFKCTFCASSGTWTRLVRYRSATNVIGEMQQLYDHHGVRLFTFKDDTFTLKRKRVLELCALIKEHFPDIGWSCLTRADCLDRELVRAMADSGCRHVELGLESGDPGVLAQVKKGETIEEVREAVEMFRDVGIASAVNIIIGFPGETIEQMQRTCDVAIAMKPARILTGVFTPYPGTEIYETQQRELAGGRERTPEELLQDWEDIYHMSPDCLAGRDQAYLDAVRHILVATSHYNESKWRRSMALARLFLTNPKFAYQRVQGRLFDNWNRQKARA